MRKETEEKREGIREREEGTGQGEIPGNEAL